MTTAPKILVSNTTGQYEPRPVGLGVLTMKVWWSDGRETSTECRNYGQAYDVIGGEAPPWEKWEIWGVSASPEPLKVGDRIVVETGCRALDIGKNSIAYVVEIQPLGAEYSYNVQVKIRLAREDKTRSLIARHQNRLSDPIINLLNPWRSGQKIQVRRKPA